MSVLTGFELKIGVSVITCLTDRIHSNHQTPVTGPFLLINKHPVVSIKSCVSSRVKGICYPNCLKDMFARGKLLSAQKKHPACPDLLCRSGSIRGCLTRAVLTAVEPCRPPHMHSPWCAGFGRRLDCTAFQACPRSHLAHEAKTILSWIEVRRDDYLHYPRLCQNNMTPVALRGRGTTSAYNCFPATGLYFKSKVLASVGRGSTETTPSAARELYVWRHSRQGGGGGGI